MFFTHLARIVAFLALALGAFHLGIGFAVVFGTLGPEALTRYAPGSPGAAIDRGMYCILFAIALGTLAEIGAHVRRN